MSETCDWVLDEPDYASWASSCGEEFIIIEGTPTENGMKFCCYCGRPIWESPENSLARIAAQKPPTKNDGH